MPLKRSCSVYFCASFPTFSFLSAIYSFSVNFAFIKVIPSPLLTIESPPKRVWADNEKKWWHSTSNSANYVSFKRLFLPDSICDSSFARFTSNYVKMQQFLTFVQSLNTAWAIELFKGKFKVEVREEILIGSSFSHLGRIYSYPQPFPSLYM